MHQQLPHQAADKQSQPFTLLLRGVKGTEEESCLGLA